MKLEVKYSSKFKKGLKLAVKRGLDISLLEKVVNKLKDRIPLEEKYQDHPLKGQMAKYRECHIQPDWLLVYLRNCKQITYATCLSFSPVAPSKNQLHSPLCA